MHGMLYGSCTVTCVLEEEEGVAIGKYSKEGKGERPCTTKR